MKRILGIATFFVVVAFGTTGCATSGYWTDRGRDALDIVTVGYGKGAGIKIRPGLLDVGLLVNFPVAELRGGEFEAMDLPWSEFWNTSMDSTLGGRANADVHYLILGVEVFRSPRLGRGKAYECGYGLKTTQNEVASITYPVLIYKLMSHSHLTQMEVCFGLGYTLRLGCNPGELVDFFLGWCGIDIYGDDTAGVSDG